MLLKCKYLAQFSVGELTKNSINIANAEARCPFLSFARSSLHSSAIETNTSQQDENKSKFWYDLKTGQPKKLHKLYLIFLTTKSLYLFTEFSLLIVVVELFRLIYIYIMLYLSTQYLFYLIRYASHNKMKIQL